MMNYEIFKKEVESRFLDYMPGEIRNLQVKIHQVDKINRTLDAISIINKGSAEKFYPTIYINEMYERYKTCDDFEETMTVAAQHMAMAVQTDIGIPLDKSTARDHIVFQVINTEQNRELLKKIPNRSFLDISVIYRWVVQINDFDIKSTIVKNSLAEYLGFTEDELFRLAEENTRRIFPVVVENIDDAIQMLITPEIADMVFGKHKSNMWVFTNGRWINGASSILYEAELHTLAEQLESDLYIIPSSIHEMLVLPDTVKDPYMLADILSSINMKNLTLEERLSNQIYHYSRKLRKFSMATDTPNKGLE